MANRRDSSSRRSRRTRPDGRGTSRPRSRMEDDAGTPGAGTQEALLRGLQQVWLAGLGALGRAQKEGPAAFGSAVVEGLRLLDTSRMAAQRLVQETLGETQGTLQSRIAAARLQAMETWDGLESMFQDRVQRAMRQLGVPTAEAIRELTESVAELQASIERMESKPRARRKAARPARGARRRPPRRSDAGTQ